MRTSRISLALAVSAWVLALTALPARAGTDVDFGTSVRAGDHTDLFFSISSRCFDRDRRAVDSWGPRFTNPDDLAVFFFLAQQSGKSPDAIFALRRQGLTWWEVGARLGVAVDAWFLPVDVDPGPPYGKAYRSWKKRRQHPSSRAPLSDADARNLVAVRVLHEYYGIPVDVAMQRRSSGRSVRRLVVDEYEHRHGRQMTGSVEKPGTRRHHR